MGELKYKYDVAISFTQRDEGVAFQIFKAIKERLNCFIYSEAQKEIAGKDGEKEFNSVFGKEAKIVVILYRNEWGKTKWTRIEETAIKNRGFDEGYNFVLLIPLDKPPIAPKWFPHNRLWIGLERWGIAGAAIVIEARFQEEGGVVVERTLADIAAESEQKLKERKAREEKINYENFVPEFSSLKAYVEEQIQDIEKKAQWKIRITDNRYDGQNMSCSGYTLFYHWYQEYRTSLMGSTLYFCLTNGILDESGIHVYPFADSSSIADEKYDFDINEFDQPGWKSRGGKFFTSKRLAEYWLEKLVKLIIKKRSPKS